MYINISICRFIKKVVIILPAKPPVNTAETSPLQGMPVSRIDYYHLGDIVRKLRLDSRMSVMEITEYINDHHFKDEDIKISHMAVQRWINKHIKEDVDNRVKDYSPNVYRETLEMMDCLSEQIEVINIYIDAVKKGIKKKEDIKANGKELKELIYLSEKLLARKQSILHDLGQMHEKVYSYSAVNEIISIILEKAKKENPLMHSEIIAFIKTNPALAEALRKIKPESRKVQ
jgi:hypothetical protein